MNTAIDENTFAVDFNPGTNHFAVDKASAILESKVFGALTGKGGNSQILFLGDFDVCWQVVEILERALEQKPRSRRVDHSSSEFWLKRNAGDVQSERN